MIGKSGWMTGTLLGAAVLMSGVAVAQTQPRYGTPDARDQQDQGDAYGDDSAAPSDQDDIASPDQSRADDDFSDVVAADQQKTGADRRAETEPAPALSAPNEESEAMVNACALAARDEAEREGGYAEVRQVETPRESRNGFAIDGDVETRSGWHAQDGRVRHFTCTVANGRIEDVYFQRERAAR